MRDRCAQTIMGQEGPLETECGLVLYVKGKADTYHGMHFCCTFDRGVRGTMSWVRVLKKGLTSTKNPESAGETGEAGLCIATQETRELVHQQLLVRWTVGGKGVACCSDGCASGLALCAHHWNCLVLGTPY